MLDQISIYYHSDSFEGKKLRGYAEGLGIPVQAIDIRKNPLTPTQIARFADKLNMDVADLIDPEHDLNPADRNAFSGEEEWAELLNKQPDVLHYPIAVRKDKVAVIRSASDVLRM